MSNSKVGTKQAFGNKPSILSEKKGKAVKTGTDPEKTKDFNLAMNQLARSKRQQGKVAILTENDRKTMGKYKDLNPKGHLRREEIYDQYRKDNKNLAREEAAYKELEDCTF